MTPEERAAALDRMLAPEPELLPEVTERVRADLAALRELDVATGPSADEIIERMRANGLPDPEA